MDYNKIIGYCAHHDDDIDISTLEYKGCWSCRHVYIYRLTDISEAAKLLDVSKSTIKRWIKEEKIKGELFVKVRRTVYPNPPNEKYYIFDESIEELTNNSKNLDCKKRCSICDTWNTLDNGKTKCELCKNIIEKENNGN